MHVVPDQHVHKRCTRVTRDLAGNTEMHRCKHSSAAKQVKQMTKGTPPVSWPLTAVFKVAVSRQPLCLAISNGARDLIASHIKIVAPHCDLFNDLHAARSELDAPSGRDHFDELDGQATLTCAAAK